MKPPESLPASKRRTSGSAAQVVEASAPNGAPPTGPGFRVPYHRSPAKAIANNEREARIAARQRASTADAAPAPLPEVPAQPTDEPTCSHDQDFAKAKAKEFAFVGNKAKRRRKPEKNAGTASSLRAKQAPTSRKWGSLKALNAGPSNPAANRADWESAISQSCARSMTFSQWANHKQHMAHQGPSPRYEADFASNAAARAAAFKQLLGTPSRLEDTGSGASTVADVDGPIGQGPTVTGAGMSVLDEVPMPAVDEAPASAVPGNGLFENGSAAAHSTHSQSTQDTDAQPPVAHHAARANGVVESGVASGPKAQSGAVGNTADAGGEMPAVDAHEHPNGPQAGDETADIDAAAASASPAAQDANEMLQHAEDAPVEPSGSQAEPAEQVSEPLSISGRNAEAAQAMADPSKGAHQGMQPADAAPVALSAAVQPKIRRKKRRHADIAPEPAEAVQEAAATAENGRRPSRKDKKRKKQKATKSLADLQGEPVQAPSGLDVLAEQATLQQEAQNAGTSPQEASTEGGASGLPQEEAAESPTASHAARDRRRRRREGQPMGGSSHNQVEDPSQAASAGGARNVPEEHSRQAGPSRRRAGKSQSAAGPQFVEYRHYEDGRKYQAR